MSDEGEIKHKWQLCGECGCARGGELCLRTGRAQVFIPPRCRRKDVCKRAVFGDFQPDEKQEVDHGQPS